MMTHCHALVFSCSFMRSRQPFLWVYVYPAGGSSNIITPGAAILNLPIVHLSLHVAQLATARCFQRLSNCQYLLKNPGVQIVHALWIFCLREHASSVLKIGVGIAVCTDKSSCTPANLPDDTVPCHEIGTEHNSASLCTPMPSSHPRHVVFVDVQRRLAIVRCHV